MFITPVHDDHNTVQPNESPAVVRPGHLPYVLSGVMAMVSGAGAGVLASRSRHENTEGCCPLQAAAFSISSFGGAR